MDVVASAHPVPLPISDALEARFLELLPTIDAIVGGLCRGRGITGADAEDVGGHVRQRFVESGYEPLRQFQERSSIATYLRVVITRWFKDYLIARHGRWRPTAAALRAGPVAVHLERLLHKGRRSMAEAIAEVMSSGDQPYSERELRELLRQLPSRDPMRPVEVSPDVLETLQAHRTALADSRIKDADADAEYRRAVEALRQALDALSPEDRVLVTMRYLDGETIAHIARALRTDPKPLYRRIERALGVLRAQLESRGVNGMDVRHIVLERTS